MKKKEFINEDALAAWDAMTNDEEKQIQGGEQSSAKVDDSYIGVTWGRSIGRLDK